MHNFIILNVINFNGKIHKNIIEIISAKPSYSSHIENCFVPAIQMLEILMYSIKSFKDFYFLNYNSVRVSSTDRKEITFSLFTLLCCLKLI